MRSPSNSRRIELVRAPDRVREHVQPAAVRHADHDLVRARRRRPARSPRRASAPSVEPLERELLLAEEALAQVLLEPLGARERRREAACRSSGSSGCAVAARLDRLAQPDALRVVREVLDLVGDRPAVDLLQRRQRLQRASRPARGRAGAELGIRACSSGVSGGIRRVSSSAGSPIGSEPSGSSLRREMAVHPMGLHERHRRGDAAEQRLVDRARRAPSVAPEPRVRLASPFRSPLAEASRRCSPGSAATTLAVAALEDRAPFGRNGVRVLEIVLEQEARVPRVRPVDVGRSRWSL